MKLKDQLNNINQDNETQMEHIKIKARNLEVENQELQHQIKAAREIENGLVQKMGQLNGEISSLKEMSEQSRSKSEGLEYNLKRETDYAEEVEKKKKLLEEQVKIMKHSPGE